MEKHFDQNERNRSMGYEETRSFLLSHGIRPLEVSEWKQGPVLYVLTEEARLQYAKYNAGLRPSIARIYTPFAITYKPRNAGGLSIPFYHIENPEGGRIDYYSINPVTEEKVLVKTSRNERLGANAYEAKEGTLFVREDSIFPDLGK